MLEGDRRNCSSKIVLTLKFASALTSESELKNIILAAFRFFAFLHSQGQTETRALRRGMSVLPPGAEMCMTGRFAPKAADQKRPLV